MAEAKNDLKAEVDTLKEDLAAIRGDLKQVANSIVDLSKSGAATAREEISQEAAERLEQLRALGDDLSARGQKVYHQAEHKVAENPIVSLATAFGVGFIIGKLMDRH